MPGSRCSRPETLGSATGTLVRRALQNTKAYRPYASPLQVSACRDDYLVPRQTRRDVAAPRLGATGQARVALAPRSARSRPLAGPTSGELAGSLGMGQIESAGTTHPPPTGSGWVGGAAVSGRAGHSGNGPARSDGAGGWDSRAHPLSRGGSNKGLACGESDLESDDSGRNRGCGSPAVARPQRRAAHSPDQPVRADRSPARALWPRVQGSTLDPPAMSEGAQP